MAGAPLLLDHLDRRGPRPLRRRQASCSTAPGVAYEVDPTLVRGLDYYTRTVFEFTSDALGAQSGVGGGGRYDGLIEQIGGPPTPGMGWAAGRRADPARRRRAPPVAQPPLDLYVAYVEPEYRRGAFRLAADARRAGYAARLELGGRSLKGQLKQADRAGRPLRCDPRRRGDVPQGHGERGAEDGGARHGDAPHQGRQGPVRPPRANPYRDAWAGELRAGASTATVRVAGWVHRRRDHGGLIFIDLRDRTGIVQLVFHPETAPDAHALAERLRPEHVVSAAGEIVRREEGNVNPKLETGEIELDGRRGRDARRGGDAAVPGRRGRRRSTRLLRLRHRVHRPAPRAACSDAMTIRHTVNRAMRDYLNAHDFLEIETPILTRSTPEGARDFLVPSRLSPGDVLRAPAVAAAVQADADDGRLRALLPDRPLLPGRGPARRPPAGVHPARPRDELRRGGGRDRTRRGDARARLRGDRLRGRAAAVAADDGYDEAMLRYGSDKPDMRFGLEITDLGEAVAETEFRVFAGVLGGGGVVRGLNAGAREVSRKDLDELTEDVKRYGAGGLVWAFVQEDGSVALAGRQGLSDDERAAIARRLSAQPGDLLLIVADKDADRGDRARRAAARARAPLRPRPRGPPRDAVGRRLPDVRVERGRGALGRAAPPVHRADRRLRRPGRAALARLRHRARRHRDRRRVDPYPPPRGPAAGLQGARDLRGGGGGALRLPARRAAVRRAAARRARARPRPDRGADRRPRLDPRRDRVPEDRERRRSAHRRARRGRPAAAGRARAATEVTA